MTRPTRRLGTEPPWQRRFSEALFHLCASAHDPRPAQTWRPGSRGRSIRRGQNQGRPRGATRDLRTGALIGRSPAMTSLTEAQRAELSRKNAAQNKRTKDDAQARGGR